MKYFLLVCFYVLVGYNIDAQCVAPVITASGPTSFCIGGSVTLTTNTISPWSKKSNFAGSPRFAAVSFSIGNKGYLGTGSTKRKAPTNLADFWEYDTARDMWTQKADFGGGDRANAVGFSIGGYGYVGTGYGNSNKYGNDFWQYDPITNRWIAKANVPGQREAAVGFSIKDSGYVGTGYSIDSIFLKDFYRYDVANDKWDTLQAFPGKARYGAAGFCIGNNGYIGTGLGFDRTFLKDFWQYSPATGNWTKKADFGGAPRQLATGFSIGSKGYIGCGYTGNTFYDFWQYDPVFDAWAQKADYPGIGNESNASFSIGGFGYMGTGYDVLFPENDFWQFSPLSYTYKWNTGDTAKSINVTKSGIYFVTVTNTSSGCSQSSNPDTIIVKDTIPRPIVTTTGNCGYSILSTTAIGNLRWNTGDTTSSIRVNSSGFYSLTVTDNNKCGPASDTEYVLINQLPDSAITASGPTTFCNGDSVILTAPGVWVKKNDFGGVSRFGAVSFSIDSKGYLGTGPSLADLWQYDPIMDVWTQKMDFAGGTRQNAVGFSIGKYGYIGTGSGDTSSYYNDFWQYDPNLNAWSRKASLPGVGRFSAVGFSIRDTGYIGTGYNGSGNYGLHGFFDDFYSYDAAHDKWNVLQSLPGGPRYGAVGFNIGNNGYIGTGGTPNNLVKDFWQYSPTAGKWTRKKDFGGSARYYAFGFSSSTSGYIGGGGGDEEAQNINLPTYFWEYNPNVDTWIKKASYPGEGRYFNSAFNIGNQGYVGTGLSKNNTQSRDFWQYTAARSYQWSTGDTTQSITVKKSGTYAVTTTNNTGCSSTSAPLKVIVNSSPAPPITVMDSCGSSTLSTTATGGLKWSTGDITSRITVAASGRYYLIQKSGACTSDTGFATAAPKTIPAAPAVTVTNNCSSSVLTASGYTGSLLWSNNATTPSITVTVAGTYTVKQTVNGCTSVPGSGTVAPKTVPVAPAVTVTNNCGSSILTASGYTGSLLWSNNATTPSITVTTAGTYTATQTVNGCTSAPGSGAAAPKTVPVITVVNNCGSSTLSTTATGNIKWSTGATSPSIIVYSAGTYSVTQATSGCTGFATAAPGGLVVVTATPIFANTGASGCNATVAFGPNVYATGSPILSYKIGNTPITSPYIFPAGVTVVTVTATSACNSFFTVFTVTVTDNQNPVITCKPATTKNVSGSYYTVSGNELDATAADNCGITTLAYSVSGATPILYSPLNTTLSGRKLNVGTNTITWTAIDFAGNSASCTTVVTVQKGNSLIACTSGSLLKTAGEQIGELQVLASPNPTSNQFTLKLQSGCMANCKIMVLDITGRKIEELTNVTANSTVQIGKSYPPGVYMAVVIQDEGKVTLKLVKGGR